MPSHLPQAIANEFLLKRDSEVWPQQMFIQKLAYISHGWNLAINNKPLIGVSPEAWDNGPVYRDVWDHIKEYGYRGPKFTLVDPDTKRPFKAGLTESEKAVIDHVWNKYGTKRADELSGMTHQPQTPWSKAYFERGRNSPLFDEDIRKHYIDLALAGRGKR